jgi:hypothetical protein
MQPSVILLEFNELSPTVIQGFMSAGKLPNFQRFFTESNVFVTDAEEAPPNLEPWIQWVTVHTGLSYRQHGVFDLGDGHKLTAPRIWDLVSNAGRTAWVCGSMNAGYRAPLRGAVLPDPWSTGIVPQPAAALDPYYHFIRRNVQEYSADRVGLQAGEVARFVGFMASHGLTARTCGSILSQLLGERGGHGRWKRASILDRMQWDVFSWYYRRLQPAFATFFLNSTAHYQHVYWRNMDPQPFSNKPSDEEQSEYQDAVLYGYQRMDELLGECMNLAGTRATIILASALGQQPCLKYEDIGGKTFYKPRDPDHIFRDLLSIPAPFEYAPVMSEEFRLYFPTEAAARDARAKLEAVRLGDAPTFNVRATGREVYAGCAIVRTLPADAEIRLGDGTTAPFFRYLYKVDITKSGMHHPDGILWIRTGSREHRSTQDKVSLRRVAPTILSLLQLPTTPDMTGSALPLTS